MEPMDTDHSPSPAALECGASFVPTEEGALTLVARFPSAVSAREESVSGTVAVAANHTAARGVVTPLADAFLLRDGHVVTLPMPQDSLGQVLDLAAGAVERLPATASLLPCAGDGVLAPGTYDLWVRVVLNHDDGSHTDSFGGPCPLEVR